MTFSIKIFNLEFFGEIPHAPRVCYISTQESMSCQQPEKKRNKTSTQGECIIGPAQSQEIFTWTAPQQRRHAEWLAHAQNLVSSGWHPRSLTGVACSAWYQSTYTKHNRSHVNRGIQRSRGHVHTGCNPSAAIHNRSSTAHFIQIFFVTSKEMHHDMEQKAAKAMMGEHTHFSPTQITKWQDEQNKSNKPKFRQQHFLTKCVLLVLATSKYSTKN